MASDGDSYSGSRPRRQRITVHQTFLTHSASEGSADAASTVGSTSSIADSMLRQSSPYLQFLLSHLWPPITQQRAEEFSKYQINFAAFMF
ncbi:hypothetical protein Taro_040135 [Colocasia esculenta]|uniref:Uncharacterized protein n=1 Tax=Colocasia esculenta TaxID=4460 RepID=A0A843WB33_COLES|nr:hypothetical protein [Colocasia esculenta]